MSGYDPVQAVLDRLENVRGRDGDHTARCPAHDDRHNSLSISCGREGQVLLYCHAGCQTAEIVAAIGLEMRDLFPQSAGNPTPVRPSTPRTSDPGAHVGQRRIVAVYDYRDEQGAVLYQAVRYVPKDFRQRRPDGNGGYLWNLDKVQRVLYALPELASADAHKIVFICEGEKDADLLRSLGLVATTNVGGAGKWRPEYNEPLRARHVVILPDNDPAGADHGRKVARSLAGVAALVKALILPGLPAKGDVSDWFALGGTVDRLIALVDATKPYDATPDQPASDTVPVWQPRITVLADVQPEPVSWFWHGRVAFGKVGVLDGDPGDGKSTITTDLAARASVGGPMPDGSYGDVSGPINVLIMSAEDGLADTIRPRLDAGGGDPTRVAVLECKIQGEGEAAVSLADLPLIRAALVATDARLLVIDPVMAYLPSASNSYRDQDVRGILAPLARMAEELGVAIIIVRHFSKTGGANAIYRGGGSIGFIGQARIGLMVGKDPDDDTGQRRILAVTKSNLAAFPPALAYHLEEAENGVARVVWEGVTEHTASMLLAVPQQADEDDRTERDEAADALRTALANGRRTQKETIREVREATGVSESTVHRARRRLGIKSDREGFGPGSLVYWRLPDVWDGKEAKPYLSHTVHTCQPPEGEKYDKYVTSMVPPALPDPAAAVTQLHAWIDAGALDRLPERITGFENGLAEYADRAVLIRLAALIVGDAPYSVTARERAGQIVSVLTPIIAGQAP